MRNKDLQPKYDAMHKQGPSSWTNTGWEERKAIINMGEPWDGLSVLEIGCGEGDLAAMMSMAGAKVRALDYSQEAIKKAEKKYPEIVFWNEQLDSLAGIERFDRLVLQGVLEHLDEPFTELKRMIDNLLKDKGDVITSSPGFVNPRGIVWMTLAILFSVPMSLTDLYFLNPWEFEHFCNKWQYKMDYESCDFGWASGVEMIDDFKQRLPKALDDRFPGNTKPYDQENIQELLKWLDKALEYDIFLNCEETGANVIYRITK